MSVRILIVLAYLGVTLFIGILFRRKAQQNEEEFFLAGRNVSSLFLFFTLAASNFSAFTMFGFSGAGYRIGYAFYPVMGFWTGFMALSLFILGKRILLLSKERHYVTPSDYIMDRYRSGFLKKLTSLIMIVFTLPYLALQAIAGGASLMSLTGLPYLAGSLLVTVFVILYVSLGGLRSIIWTDFIQGLMMLVFAAAAFFIIIRGAGGFAESQRNVFAEVPEFFSRPGGGGAMGRGVWFSYMILWFFGVPLSPHMFQRFIAAKDQKSLKQAVVFYPLITTFLFFLTVSIGVIGRGVIPGLPAQESDTIFPLLLGRFAGTALSTLLLTGTLAALMSTMDSQLLTMTSMISRDFRKTDAPGKVKRERLIVIILGAAGFLISIRPPETILSFINATTFNGLSVLAPMVFGGLFWKKGSASGAAASIFTGEILVVLYYLKLLPSGPFLPVIPVVAASAVVYIFVSLLTEKSRGNSSLVFPVDASKLKPGLFFLAFTVLGHDFWRWGKNPVFFLSLPVWIWYFFVLGVLLSLCFKFVLRAGRSSLE